MPSPDKLKIWTNKLKQFSYPTYNLERVQLHAACAIFSLHCLKSSISMCCYFARVHCKSSFLLFAPQHNIVLFRNTVSNKYSLSQKTKDFRLYEQIFLYKCQQGERRGKQLLCSCQFAHRDQLCFYLCSSLLCWLCWCSKNVKQYWV